MEKIRLQIIGLSRSELQTAAYALLLEEEGGQRRLPIIIASSEAQSIAIELENLKPSRPLTHDLFKSLASAFKIELREIIIHNLVEGTFFAKLICVQNDEVIEIDSRTSDAVAIAVRFKCPIFTYDFILSTAGLYLESDDKLEDLEEEIDLQDEISLEQLELDLNEALENEDYELASRIRDELNKRKNKN